MSCAFMRFASLYRWFAWPTRFGAIIARTSRAFRAGLKTRARGSWTRSGDLDGFSQRAASTPGRFVVRRGRRRDRIDSDLRAAAPHSRDAGRADGAQRRVPDRVVLPVALAAARNGQLVDSKPRAVRGLRDYRAVS